MLQESPHRHRFPADLYTIKARTTYAGFRGLRRVRTVIPETVFSTLLVTLGMAKFYELAISGL